MLLCSFRFFLQIIWRLGNQLIKEFSDLFYQVDWKKRSELVHVEECEDTVEDIIYPLFDLIQDSIMINRYIKHRDSNVLYHSPKDTHVVENCARISEKIMQQDLFAATKKNNLAIM